MEPEAEYSLCKGASMAAAESTQILVEGELHYILDPDTGEKLLLKGYGAFKDALPAMEEIDLTLPIAEQVFPKKVSGKPALPPLRAAHG